MRADHSSPFTVIEVGGGASVLIAQPYATGGLFKKKTATVGESVFVGNREPLF